MMTSTIMSRKQNKANHKRCGHICLILDSMILCFHYRPLSFELVCFNLMYCVTKCRAVTHINLIDWEKIALLLLY